MPRSGCTSHCGAPRCRWWSPPLWWRSASDRWCQGNSCRSDAANGQQCEKKKTAYTEDPTNFSEASELPIELSRHNPDTCQHKISTQITMMPLPAKQLQVYFYYRDVRNWDNCFVSVVVIHRAMEFFKCLSDVSASHILSTLSLPVFLITQIYNVGA